MSRYYIATGDHGESELINRISLPTLIGHTATVRDRR